MWSLEFSTFDFRFSIGSILDELHARSASLGSARASSRRRGSDGAIAIANFSGRAEKDCFGDGAETSTRWRVRSPEC
jgi:hypothetical protein